MFSVLRQEQRYVGKAGVSSFLLPGSGQFMIGEPLKGAAFMLAQAAIIGGTMAGVHYLLPAAYTALRGDPTAMRAYVRNSDRTAFLPAMGVMAGGLTLAIANSVLSSRLAASGARDKIESGKIVFKPNLLYSSAGMGMGFRFVY
jgi:TM2 domain-containing membrane protein YozV